jgi:ABC-2 type transport system permease protein
MHKPVHQTAPLSFWSRVRLVARRELLERTRQRSFVISTVISVLILVGVIVAPSLLDRPTSWRIGVTNIEARELADTAKQLLLAAEPDASMTIVEYQTEESGRNAVKAGKIRSLIIGRSEGDRSVPPLVVVDRRVGDTEQTVFDAAIQLRRIARDSARLGISDSDAAALAAPGRFDTDAINRPDTQREGDINIARVAGVVMFIQVLQFGMAVATGVVEEKSSRVLEVLLGRMRPRALLTGKLLGIGALGLAQSALFIACGLIAIEAVGSVNLSGGSLVMLASLLGWFVLGYGLFSALFLMAGAVAGRQEDLQNTSGLSMTVAMLAYFGSVFAAGAPESAAARIVSMIPFSAPMSMPVRIASGDATAIEVVVAIVGMLATLVGLVALASRIYERTLLATTQQSLFGQLRRGAAR